MPKYTDTKRQQNKEKKKKKLQHNMKQGAMALHNSQKTIKKMAIVSSYLSVITLNINRLNFSKDIG